MFWKQRGFWKCVGVFVLTYTLVVGTGLLVAVSATGAESVSTNSEIEKPKAGEKKIVVPEKKKVLNRQLSIMVDEIAYLEATTSKFLGGCYIHLVNGERLHVSPTLDNAEAAIKKAADNSELFVRFMGRPL